MAKTPDTVRSANMRAIKSKDTKPEMVVRRCAHALGYRYRLHDRRLPGCPDLVFKGRRAVIFVHGCYWHGHGCKRGGSGAKSNVEYWGPKIARNISRDADASRKLEQAGWRVMTIWECELKDHSALAVSLAEFLGKRS